MTQRSTYPSEGATRMGTSTARANNFLELTINLSNKEKTKMPLMVLELTTKKEKLKELRHP